MGKSVTYPDGTTLTSSALTVPAFEAIMQPLTLAMLGIPSDVNSPAVRMTWPTSGQPGWNINEDICFLRFTLVDADYDKIRDRQQYPAGQLGFGQGPYGGQPYGGTETTCQPEVWTYTRAWEIHFCAYGPNSFDNLRAIRSAFFLDYFTEQFQVNNLYPVSEYPQVIRAPENFNGQWWERADFKAQVYELVIETIQRQTVESVEVTLDVVDTQGYGEVPFGEAPFGEPQPVVDSYSVTVTAEEST